MGVTVDTKNFAPELLSVRLDNCEMYEYKNIHEQIGRELIIGVVGINT
jgi:hypothetical protein